MILDGRKYAEQLIEEYRAENDRIAEKTGRRTTLAVIQVGADPASSVYVRQKEKACARAGIRCDVIRVSGEASLMQVYDTVAQASGREDVDGVIVQLPLPEAMRSETQFILDRISWRKDVDGLTSFSQGALFNGTRCLVPCTPKGIVRLLKKNNIELEGLNVTIIGRSLLVGMPLSVLMTRENATVTVCHSMTGRYSLAKNIQHANVVVCAVGKPGFLNDRGIISGKQILVDVGINRTADGIEGDIARGCCERAGYYTPVPGGVGPMTVAMLIENTMQARRGF